MKPSFLPLLLLIFAQPWLRTATRHPASTASPAAFEDLRPTVTSVSPMGGALAVNPCTAVSAYVHVPTPGGVDNATITTTTVRLYQVNADNTLLAIDVRVNGTGGGDAINLSPVVGLKANTKYKFVVTDGVRSSAGHAFYPFESYFTTGGAQATPTLPNVAFDRVAIAGTGGQQYTSLAIGPDRKLYALLLGGGIRRFPIGADGNLGTPQLIGTLTTRYGARMATGLAFDPGATAANPVVWVSHSSDGQLDAAPAFDGKLSRLSGANLENEQLVVTNLPRSRRDHLVNSLAFRPGQPTALYFNQGSNSAVGAYDETWYRQEALLSAAVLKLDLAKLPATLPLDVRTTNNRAAINNASPSSYLMPVNGVNYYNPYATTSPLTIYASGVRNAFDLAWHSNGYLYVPTNGSNSGGNTPASVAGTRRPDGTFYNGPAVDSTFNVQTQQDWLFKINPNLLVNGKDYHGYFGHPNPLRGEYALNRGSADNARYPAGTAADANYQGIAYSFATNKSPNGVIEYKSNAFSGALKGKLLVCRFSNLNDILVLEPGLNGDIGKTYGDCGGAIPGLRGFVDPLDVVEDPQTGNLYVSEFGWGNPAAAQLTLCRVRLPSRINAGGNAYTAADGRNFAPDSYFTGGMGSSPAPGDVLNTTDDYLYQTGRHGTTSFGYSLPVKAGDYDVVLHFNETYFGNTAAGGIGARKFNVDAEGIRRLTDYDIFARAGGAMRAVRETVRVTVSDGQLDLLFSKGRADNPRVSAIEVLPASLTNRAPVLAAIGGKTVAEGQVLAFAAAATDADGPAQTLTYALLNAPAGAVINPTTGAFSWTPTETQGPGSYAFTVKVADNGSPMLSDGETISVTVSEANRAPVLAAIGSKSVLEGQTLTFTATSTDPDLPAQARAYSLLNAPTGATINALTGQFSWMPTAAQGPATYTFTVKVADNGFPVFSDQETITVTVHAGNAAPVLAAIGNKTVVEAQRLTFIAKATDADGASQTLTYSLVNAPAGATINATTGQFSWTPTWAQGPASYPFTVKATDNGSPALSDQETITVTVREPTTVFRINAGGAGYTMLDSRVFRSDAYYSKGEITQVSGDILNTADDYLYRTAREGLDPKRRRNKWTSFTYQLPTGSGTFDVTLYFAEIYWGKLVAGGAGSRKFHVDMEGTRKLTDYDIIARTGGAMRPVRETFRVRVTDGVLTLHFLEGSRDIPIVSAIEVVSAPVTTMARAAVAEAGPADAEAFRAQAMPVPVRDRLSVVVNIPASRVKATALTDAAGRTYRVSAPQLAGENRLVIDVSGLKSGMYLLHLESDKGRRVLKFVKE